MKEVKNIKIVIIWTVLAIVFLHPLVYWKFSHLTKDDLTWMEPYEEGDIVLFSSPSDMDTLVVQEKSWYNSYWPFVMNEGEGNDYTANSSFKYDIRHDGKSVNGWSTIQKEHDGRLSLVLWLHRRRQTIEDAQNVRYCSIKIGKSVYDDAIRIDGSNSQNFSEEKITNEYFIWSKSKGLLQYKYLNGEVYTFYKKIPRKK